MTDVFVSYSTKDREFVHRLVRDLENAGLRVFFDQRVTPGESWAETLANAIEAARFLLVVLTPDYLSSKWAQEELKVGLLRESEGRASVIPLMVRQCEPPGFLASKTYADFTQDYNEGLKRLLPVLAGTVPGETTEPTPGGLEREVTPSEIAQLRRELKEAVQLFRSEPSRREAGARLDAVPAVPARRCFIVMPFGDEDLEVVYSDFVRPVLQTDCGLACERGDDLFGSNVIMDDIRGSIDAADVVVADLTGKNANVFYEIGICHTVGKAVLLMAQSIDDVPFDLRHRRVLLYEYSPRGCKRLEKALKENMSAILEKALSPKGDLTRP